MSNQTSSCLSNISLRWMVNHIMKSGCGIQFDDFALKLAQINVVDIETGVEPTPEELSMDKGDALQPIHDELKLDILWWLLEIIPMTFNWQGADGVWHKDFG